MDPTARGGSIRQVQVSVLGVLVDDVGLVLVEGVVMLVDEAAWPCSSRRPGRA